MNKKSVYAGTLLRLKLQYTILLVSNEPGLTHQMTSLKRRDLKYVFALAIELLAENWRGVVIK